MPALPGPRPSRLARAGRRQALSRYSGAERAHRRRPAARIRTALREIVARFGCDPILMPGQDIILSEIRPRIATRSKRLLREHGVRLAEDLMPAERWALACPALPTCGLALTEAERVRDDIVAAIEGLAAPWGSSASGSASASPAARMAAPGPIPAISASSAACPVITALYVGGDFDGTRLNTAIADKVALGEIGRSLDPLFALYASDRTAGEGFRRFLPPRRAAGASAGARGEHKVCGRHAADHCRPERSPRHPGRRRRSGTPSPWRARRGAAPLHWKSMRLPRPCARRCRPGQGLRRRLPLPRRDRAGAARFSRRRSRSGRGRNPRGGAGAGALVNVEDDPRRSDFHSPSVFRRGDLTVAISTNGKSPVWQRCCGGAWSIGWGRSGKSGSKRSRPCAKAGVKPAPPGGDRPMDARMGRPARLARPGVFRPFPSGVPPDTLTGDELLLEAGE